jgi:hypothetical protein
LYALAEPTSGDWLQLDLDASVVTVSLRTWRDAHRHELLPDAYTATTAPRGDPASIAGPIAQSASLAASVEDSIRWHFAPAWESRVGPRRGNPTRPEDLDEENVS